MMERYGFLKELRKSRGMTQTQVGILAGMSKSQISRMENGSLGSPETVDKVLAAKFTIYTIRIGSELKESVFSAVSLEEKKWLKVTSI